MFAELTSSINVLTKYLDQGSTTLLTKSDAVYGGDVRKWVVYANSLMLRLAMRVYYADASLSQQYAMQAINHPLGVMKSKEDEAKMERGAGLVFVNNLDILINQYNECRMGSSMFAYLGGYQDPRLPKYFETSNSRYGTIIGSLGRYFALPTGHDEASNATFEQASKPRISSSTPTYWMRASEVYFLLAEAALRNWAVGETAEDLYKKGIAMSFAENDIPASEVDAYMRSGRTPMEYRLNVFSLGSGVTVQAPTNATVAWGNSTESNLEKIIIQKWIALYPNGQEAWSEQRRTGYPKLHTVLRNNSNGEIDTQIGIRRMRYPTNRSTSAEDIENLRKAEELLIKGPDKAGTRLWWDNK